MQTYKRKWTQLLALLLVIALSLTLIALPAAADETESGAENAVASGSCGDDLTWVLDGDGALTISGTGAMSDWSDYKGLEPSTDSPWYGYAENIKTVIINSGVTTIGSSAFSDCINLESVTIPEGVTYIGHYAFSNCASLSSITLPDDVAYLGVGVFSDCVSLKEITMPSSMAEPTDSGASGIGARAFSGCESLSEITIPDGIVSITIGMFENCASLTTVTIPASVQLVFLGAFDYCSNLTSIIFEGDAPVFSNDSSSTATPVIFDGVTATAYYPANNDTWTADVMQDYGGSITWVASGADDDDNNDDDNDDNGTVTIPEDAYTFNGHSYKIYASATSFDEAEAACEAMGGHLATVTSADEDTFLYAMAIEEGYKSVYFGLIKESDIWHWVTGEDFSYSNWASGEPNNEGTGEYIGMYYYKYTGTWNDGTWDDVTPYICEWDCVGENKSDNDVTIGEISVSKLTADEENGDYYTEDYDALYAGDTISLDVEVTVDADSTLEFSESDWSCSDESAVVFDALNVFTSEDDTKKVYYVSITASLLGTCYSLGKYPITFSCYGSETSTEVDVELSGMCGDNVVWKYDLNNYSIITISGEGEMWDWNTLEDVPWWAYHTFYTYVVIEEGVTSIGKNTFSGSTSMVYIVVPASVTKIELSAFQDCINFTDIYYAGSADDWAGVTTEGEYDDWDEIAIHCNSSSPDESSYFVLKSNTNSFFHSWSAFSTESMLSYYMDDQSKVFLLKNASSKSRYKDLQELMNETVEVYENGKNSWEGSCFGLETTMIMELKNCVFCDDDGYYGMSAPNQYSDLEFLSYINYFHLWQYATDDLVSCGTVKWGAFITGKSYYSLSHFLEKLTEEAKNSQATDSPFVFCFTEEDGGHAVIVCGCNEGEYIVDGTQYKYEIVTYDCNDTSVRYRYLYVTEKYSDFSYQDGNAAGKNINLRDVYKNMKYIGIDEMEVLAKTSLYSSANSVETTSIDESELEENGQIEIIASVGQSFSITNEAGETFVYDGVSGDGTMTVYSFDETVSDNNSGRIYLVVDASDTFTITDFGDGLEIAVEIDGTYYKGGASGADTILLSGAEGVVIEGDSDYTFVAAVSADLDSSDLIKVSGNSGGKAQLYVTENSVELITDDECSSVTVELYQGIEYSSETVEGTIVSLAVTDGEDGKAVISASTKNGPETTIRPNQDETETTATPNHTDKATETTTAVETNTPTADSGTDEDGPVPDTGDEANLALWLVLALACAGGMAGVALTAKKRRAGNK
ncbi:MAG: leucine-rich repeat protein [Oscillospiraceae bacterium]|nr:leucine-rich repeat protein [Oscillospiraceae bacterium]